MSGASNFSEDMKGLSGFAKIIRCVKVLVILSDFVVPGNLLLLRRI